MAISFDLESIEKKKALLDSARPLDAISVESLRSKFTLDFVYHSNAIEGNTLNLRETQVVLEGITVGGKTLREHFEAINHRDAIVYIEQLAVSEAEIDSWEIRNIHSLVLKSIDEENAGKFRRHNVVIQGTSTKPSDFLHVEQDLELLIHGYYNEKDLSIIERVARFHAEFEKIHPFVDGNGRTGRLVLNLELLKHGYPIAVIRKEERLAYYQALDQACVSSNYDAITDLVARAVDQSLDLYIDTLGLTSNHSTEAKAPGN